MSTIADNLQTLIDCKTDMKSAIESKGVAVSGGLSTYADAIRSMSNTNNVIKCEQGLRYNLNDSTKTLVLDAINITDATGLCANGDGADKYNSAKKIVIVNLGGIQNISSMFYCNKNLETIDLINFDSSNVSNMNVMFYECTSLTSIPLFDCSSISTGTNIDIFQHSTPENLTYIGGFKNLGKVPGFSKPTYFLGTCSNLTHESVMNVINNLYDRASAGYSNISLKFHVNSLALLSDEEKAIAINKGWTLIS